MIINKKKYEEAIKKAGWEAEAKTAFRFEQEKRREQDERERRGEIEQLYRVIDNLRGDLYKSMTDLERRINRLDHADSVVPVCTERGKHERF